MNKAMRILKMLARPLMNQRGQAGEGAPDPNAFEIDENGFIAGTNYKSVQDLIKGHGELKNKFDAQGNELGQVRGRAQELAEREAAKSRQQFLRDNPRFDEPETQQRIRDFLAGDATGMHDEISAFFKLQADESAAQLDSAASQNTEMRKILELQQGKDSTGRVMTKGHSPQPAPKATATGKDLHDGMADVLRKLRGEI